MIEALQAEVQQLRAEIESLKLRLAKFEPVQALPPPILRPTQRPKEKGLRQKLWDKGLEIEQMAQEYARGDSLEIIAVRWDVSQPSARGYILLAGGKMRPSSLPGPKRRFGRAKGIPLNISDSERQRRASQAKINAETRAQNNRDRRTLRHKREDAFRDDHDTE